MDTNMNPDEAWTAAESAEFAEKLRVFRKRLPERQRKAFLEILAGATAAFRLSESAGEVDRADAAFSHAVAAFRDGLPSRQRDAFSRIMTASALAWGLAADRDCNVQGGSGGGLGTVYFWHLVHFFRTAAVIIAGGILVLEEALEEEDAEAPDLTGIPTTPEEL